MAEDDLTLGGGPTKQYTGHVSQDCILETCIILLTNSPNKFDYSFLKYIILLRFLKRFNYYE